MAHSGALEYSLRVARQFPAFRGELLFESSSGHVTAKTGRVSSGCEGISMFKQTLSVIALFLVIGGCAPKPVVGTKPADVFTSDTIKRQDLTGYAFFDGKMVIPDTAQGIAYSPYATPVLSVLTGVGKQVEKGEPIVKLTIVGADSAAATAQSNVASAESSLAAQKGDGSEAVRSAQKNLAEAQAAEKLAKDTMANGGSADVESATRARVDAQAALRQAQRELNTSLQPNKLAVEQASLALRAAKADAAKGIVRAPVTGTVVSLEAQPGMAAKAKQSLATIVNFNKVRVQGLVLAELKDLVVKDSKVIISMEGGNSDPLDGVVLDVTVAPPVEGQKSPGYLAVIAFKNPGAMSKPSTTVKRVGVLTGKVKAAVVAPVGALSTKDGKTTVMVKNGEEWVETPIQTGVSDGALIEVKSGLKEGDVVRVRTQPDAVKGM